MTALAKKLNRVVTILQQVSLPIGESGRLDRSYVEQYDTFAGYEPVGAKYSGRQDLQGASAIFTIRQDVDVPGKWDSNNLYIRLLDPGSFHRIFKVIKYEDFYGEYLKLFCEEEEGNNF